MFAALEYSRRYGLLPRLHVAMMLMTFKTRQSVVGSATSCCIHGSLLLQNRQSSKARQTNDVLPAMALQLEIQMRFHCGQGSKKRQLATVHASRAGKTPAGEGSRRLALTLERLQYD
jgi:hypothetical protein